MFDISNYMRHKRAKRNYFKCFVFDRTHKLFHAKKNVFLNIKRKTHLMTDHIFVLSKKHKKQIRPWKFYGFLFVAVVSAFDQKI